MRIASRLIVPALSLLAVAAAPAAAVTFTGSAGAPDPGPAAGESILVDFNSATLPAGYTLTGSFGLATGTATGMAAPAGDTTQYLYTSPSIPNGVATLSTLDLKTVSFYWGSVDNYNSVDVLGANGVVLRTISGSEFSPASGNQSDAQTNQRIYLTAEGSEVITGLRFTATGIAFEVDDVAGTLAGPGNGSTVPEPATWGLMIAGFTMVGLGARRRRGVARVAA